jgi:hypothetical protein
MMPAVQEPRVWKTPESFAKLSDLSIDESSGLAASPTVENRFYTHNDSGDSARYFRFDASGKVDAVVRLEGAEAIDWEDMASASIDGKSYLYFGDIGDNQSRRPFVTIYRVAEPVGNEISVRAERMDVTYSDKPHNAETLLVDPKSGEIQIVTKVSSGPAQIFSAGPFAAGKKEMKLIGEVTISSALREARLITGGSWSPCGGFVVLRTYLGAYEYPLGSSRDWWGKTPTRIRTNLEMQGEAITYSKDGSFLLTSSEGKPCPISIIRR